MKKVFLSLLATLVTISMCFSQDSLMEKSSFQKYKATRGRFATELNVNPIKGELSLNNALNQIKLRHFVQDNLALRLGFIISSKSQNIDNSNPYGTTPIIWKEEKKSRTLGLNIGIEKHFKGTERLSPYIAGEVSYAVKSSSHDIDNGNNSTEIKGAWRTVVFNNNFSMYNYEERGFTKIGLNFILGFDYYVAKHLYLGYEMGLGITNTKYADIETKIPSNSTPQNNSSEQDLKEFSLGPNLINGIRIGFVF